MKKTLLILMTVILALVSTAAYAFDIQLDYSYDTSGFFTADRKTALSNAMSVFTSRITTSLSAITPGGSNTWTNTFMNPGTGTNTSRTDASINANTLYVYVGGYAQTGSLALGGPGGYSGSGDAGWLDTLATRGRTTSVFSPWGGAMSFDTATSWYFGADDAVPAGQYDFYSVAIHEMGHVLGIGTSDPWTSKLSGNTFTGTYAVAMYGSAVPTSGAGDENAHWAAGTQSTVPGTSTAQEASMTPSIDEGKRKYFTNLDWAALQDIGWDVAAVPEPVSMFLFLLGLPVVLFFRKRQR